MRFSNKQNSSMATEVKIVVTTGGRYSMERRIEELRGTSFIWIVDTGANL